MDSEISAMAKIAESLEALDEAAKFRVLKWAFDRFTSSGSIPNTKNDNGNFIDDKNPPNTNEDKEFESIAELFAKINPSSSSDKLLVASYWHQEILGNKELNSADINKDLKNLGHGVSHISERFETLINQKPQLALQIKKSGSNRQGRKKYKLTKAGIDKIKELLK